MLHNRQYIEFWQLQCGFNTDSVIPAIFEIDSLESE